MGLYVKTHQFTDKDDKNIHGVVTRIALRYSQINSDIEFDELYQRAWEIAQVAKGSYRPGYGTKLTTYIYRAVTRCLGTELCNRRAVVSKELPDTIEAMDKEGTHEHVLGHFQLSEGLLDRARKYRRVREVIASRKNGHLAMAQLIEGRTAKEVATLYGTTQTTVRSAVTDAKRHLKSDVRLRVLCR